AAVAALKDPDIPRRVGGLGQDIPTPQQMQPAPLRAFQPAEFAKWKPIIEKANVKGERPQGSWGARDRAAAASRPPWARPGARAPALADQLQPDRQALVREAAGQRNRWLAAQVGEIVVRGPGEEIGMVDAVDPQRLALLLSDEGGVGHHRHQPGVVVVEQRLA